MLAEEAIATTPDRYPSGETEAIASAEVILP
jgi:hypothetical protein